MNWKLIIVLALLSCLAFAQRGGGGGGHSSSRSSSSRRSRRHHNTAAEIAACKQQCDTSSDPSDPTKLDECYQACDPSLSWKAIGLFGAGVAGIIAWVRKSEQKKRQSIIERFKTEHTQSLVDYEASTQEINSKFTEFMNHNWHFVVFQTVNSYESDNFAMKPVTSESDKYLKKILISSKDQLGPWKGQAYFSFGKQGIRFWMMKDYQDKKASGQSGKWTYLTFSGFERNGQFSGDWEFEGFKGHSEYSGMFRLMQVKKE